MAEILQFHPRTVGKVPAVTMMIEPLKLYGYGPLIAQPQRFGERESLLERWTCVQRARGISWAVERITRHVRGLNHCATSVDGVGRFHMLTQDFGRGSVVALMPGDDVEKLWNDLVPFFARGEINHERSAHHVGKQIYGALGRVGS